MTFCCCRAGPLLTAMPFNDLRNNSNFTNGHPVPAYPYVFHQYANNFYGNQCGMGQAIDCEKSPDNLQYRLARGFSMGAILTVTLRDTEQNNMLRFQVLCFSWFCRRFPLYFYYGTPDQ